MGSELAFAIVPASPPAECEIYLPAKHNDGRAVDAGLIESIKARLANAFGGYTHLQHRSEGAWRMGGVTFTDEVTIVRVLDDGKSAFNMADFKHYLERVL